MIEKKINYNYQKKKKNYQKKKKNHKNKQTQIENAFLKKIIKIKKLK